MRQRFENSGTFLNEATRLLTLLVALHPGKWHAAKAQFAIQFGDRFVLTV